MRKLFFISAFFAWLLICLFVSPVRAKIITVDDNGPADFNSIQAAVNNSNDGDIIQVTLGTYTRQFGEDIDLMGKDIIVCYSDPNDTYVLASISSDPNVAQAHPASGLSYVPNELIVKFKKAAADILAAGISEGKRIQNLQLSDSLDKLNKKYKSHAAKALFKNFKRNRQRVNNLMKKDKALLTKPEKRILKRLGRASKGANIPNLDRIYKIKLAPGQSAVQAVKEYNSDLNVEYAELNYVVSINVIPNDPLYSQQWALSKIDAPQAWDIHTGSSEIIVAVVDTGVDYTHRDLAGNLWVNSGEIPSNGIDDDGNGYIDDVYGYDFINNDSNPKDDHGHGTHCSGVISAATDNGLDIAGVCWDAKIMGLKFLGSSGSGPISDAVEAFYYAVNNGADIVSNSWGGGGFMQSAQDAIDYAYSQGVIMVASAGNDNSPSPQYPAYYNHMFAVAATDSDDNRASFSTYGSWVDIAAPGVNVLSLRATGTSMGTVYDSYTTFASGTSMACPHVSGACAILLSVNPEITVDEVTDILKQSADPIAAEICQSGRLNIYEAFFVMVQPKGMIRLDEDAYSCSSNIEIRLADSDLLGNATQEVAVTTSGGDSETVILTETSAGIGVFSGTITTSSTDPNNEDGILQILHDQSITATYEDANDGTGSPDTTFDTAVADCQGPVIFNVLIDIPGPEPTVTFETNEPTTVRVLCDISCEDPNFIVRSNSIPMTNHSIKLIGISPETEYFFIVEATDSVGNMTTDDNAGQCYNFTTDGPGDIYVPSDCLTIQEAIDISWDGGIVHIADGTYTGSGNRNIDFKGKAIIVRSENGPENCIVICSATSTGFYFHNSEGPNSVLDGFTITNGSGRLVCGQYGCVYRGGAIYCRKSSPTIKNCIITNNSANYGGGVDFDGGSANIINCIISNNNATGGGRGGGIYAFSNATISNCIISNNSSNGSGGGVYGSGLTITNCVVTNNSLGGILAHYTVGDNIITNCTIVGNSDNSYYSYGGGVRVYCSDTTVTNCIIRDNSAKYGDQMSLWSWASPRANATVSYSNIEGGESAVYRNDGSTLNWGLGNIDADPLFIDPAPSEYSYHLLNDSPCIDAGTNTPYGGLPATDGDENPRIVDGDNNGTVIVDMGPFEYDPSTMPPVLLQDPAEIEFVTPFGINPAMQTVSISNRGGGTLDWSIGEDCPWLEVFPSSGQCTVEANEITLSVDVNGLAAGMYSYSLDISSSNAVYTPITVDITLYVTATFHVPSNYSTIQEAVDAVIADNFTIIVADGVYAGAGNTPINFGGKNFTLRSEYGPENCIIDAQNSNRAFTFNSGESSLAVLDGFTIKNGSAGGGGAIYCSESNPTIKNCIISDNSASDDGGGIHSYNCSPTITDCLFRNNSASDFGGAIYAWGQRIKISNCIFENNSADRGGGILYQSSKNTNINNCIFSNNSASRGGAICYQASKSYDMTINNCTFSGNSGSAVYLYWSTATMTNSVLWDNPGYDIKLTNSSYHSNFTVSYTDLQGGQPSISKDSGCTLNWGVGNIDADPLFVTGPEGNYYLSQAEAGQASDSPCINTGSDTAANLGLDIYTTRTDEMWDEGIVDIGYHYEAPIPTPISEDLDIYRDFHIDLLDVAVLATNWTSCKDPCDPNFLLGDIDLDGCVDFYDIYWMFQFWQNCLVTAASNPDPVNGRLNADPNAILSWTAGDGAIAHDVYFGINYNEVNDANLFSIEYMGTVNEPNFDPGSLGFGTEYFWRIDEIGPKCSAKGSVWSFTTVSEPNLADGLLSHWKLDETNGTTAYDSAGDNHGTLYGNPNWTTGGQINGALDFDGDGDYVQVADDDSLRFNQSNAFSISLWAKPISTGGFIVCKMRNGGCSSGKFGYQIRFNGEFDFYIEKSCAGTTVVSTSTGSTRMNVWSHLVMVYDNKDMKVYLNGVLNNSGTFGYDTGATEPENFLTIGSRSYDGITANYFDGIVDDVLIYDRVLTGIEIQQLYNAGISP